MSELVDAAGGLKGKIAKAISGGPMMGFALYDLTYRAQKQLLHSCSLNMMPYLKPRKYRPPASTADAV